MATARISFPPGLTTRPGGAGTRPFPETASRCQQLISMISASSDPLEHSQLVNELAALSLSLSSQLTASKTVLDMEAVRLANAQAINDDLRKKLAATEDALATTASMLAVQAANAVSAHASLEDERAIATAVIRELVVKEDALQTATAMLNAQNSNLESAHASLHEKDQEIIQKNREIYAKNIEIQQMQRAGEARNSRFTSHRMEFPELNTGAVRNLFPSSSDGEGSGSLVGQRSLVLKAQNAALIAALAEKVNLLSVEEHRTASLRNLLNESIIEVGRWKMCLEEATNQTRHTLPENTHPRAARSGPQSSNVQIARLKEALAEKTNLLKVEEHRSSNLRNLLNESIIEVGRLKTCSGSAGDATRPPILDSPQHIQDVPGTPTGQKIHHHEKPRQADKAPYSDHKKGLQHAEQIEDREAEVNAADEGGSLTDEENGMALSTASTQVQNGESFIWFSEGALLMNEEPGSEHATVNTEFSNERPSVAYTDEDNFYTFKSGPRWSI
ncbi:unnamed protein product [Tuber aestivum]|uniref:Uncharacterized protein n=1 Tax=Tuber aestivum TaxID=59557 RepID=A0A292Q682_9PEZI|nr:unnamed protein product [Tuber aestivum]